MYLVDWPSKGCHDGGFLVPDSHFMHENIDPLPLQSYIPAARIQKRFYCYSRFHRGVGSSLYTDKPSPMCPYLFAVGLWNRRPLRELWKLGSRHRYNQHRHWFHTLNTSYAIGLEDQNIDDKEVATHNYIHPWRVVSLDPRLILRSCTSPNFPSIPIVHTAWLRIPRRQESWLGHCANSACIVSIVRLFFAEGLNNSADPSCKSPLPHQSLPSSPQTRKAHLRDYPLLTLPFPQGTPCNLGSVQRSSCVSVYSPPASPHGGLCSNG